MSTILAQLVWLILYISTGAIRHLAKSPMSALGNLDRTNGTTSYRKYKFFWELVQ